MWQVKRLGLQEYGRGYFFKLFELLLSASSHPNALVDLDRSGEEFVNRPCTMMQRVVKLMFHELTRLLIDAGATTAGTLPLAVNNMDLEATRTLVEYGGVDPKADNQRDEYGRSPLELATITRRVRCRPSLCQGIGEQAFASPRHWKCCCSLSCCTLFAW